MWYGQNQLLQQKKANGISKEPAWRLLLSISGKLKMSCSLFLSLFAILVCVCKFLYIPARMYQFYCFYAVTTLLNQSMVHFFLTPLSRVKNLECFLCQRVDCSIVQSQTWKRRRILETVNWWISTLILMEKFGNSIQTI